MARALWGLIFAVLVVFAAAYSGEARSSTNSSYDAALSACQSYIGSSAWSGVLNAPSNAGHITNPHCASGVSTTDGSCGAQQVCVHWSWDGSGDYSTNAWSFAGDVPPVPGCSAEPPFDVSGDTSSPGSSKMCIPGVGGGTAPHGCAFAMTQTGNAFQNSSGKWKINYHVVPDGGTCTKSSDGSPDTYGDGGTSATPTDLPTPTLPVVPTIQPQLCEGGSCYNPNTGDACAVVGGVQACYNVGNMKPGEGGCASAGGGSLCAGSPSPPLPASPPITDPATQIQSSDAYPAVTDSGTGQTVTVNVYAPSGVTTSSGQGPGDSGPPSSSSSGSPGDGTNASGGGDCNSPPVCEGSPATCMVARQVWLLRCPPGGDTSNDADTSVPGLDGVGQSADPSVFKSVTLLDKLDTGGFGGGTQCPHLPPIVVPMFNIDYEDQPPGWCDLLTACGKVIMLLASFVSLRILSEK